MTSFPMHRWLVWNILFPAQEWAKGHPTLGILREMEALDRRSPVELQRLQAARLREFIAYAYAHVPYVRGMMQRAGVEPSDIQGPADLRRLPLLRKADILQNREKLRSERAGKLTPFSTGGSTGAPLLFDLPKERIACAVACRQRVTRWWGLSVGDREVALWGSPVEVTRQDRLRKLRDWLFATELFSAFEMSEAVMSRYLDRLARGGYRMIFAYPSSIHLLCQYARKQGRDLRGIGIKAVFVTGEVLFPEQRELISETLNCPVANGYGGRESGFIAHECPRGGMHILADTTVVEVLDSDGPGGAGGRARRNRGHRSLFAGGRLSCVMQPAISASFLPANAPAGVPSPCSKKLRDARRISLWRPTARYCTRSRRFTFYARSRALNTSASGSRPWTVSICK